MTSQRVSDIDPELKHKSVDKQLRKAQIETEIESYIIEDKSFTDEIQPHEPSKIFSIFTCTASDLNLPKKFINFTVDCIYKSTIDVAFTGSYFAFVDYLKKKYRIDNYIIIFACPIFDVLYWIKSAEDVKRFLHSFNHLLIVKLSPTHYGKFSITKWQSLIPKDVKASFEISNHETAESVIQTSKAKKLAKEVTFIKQIKPPAKEVPQQSKTCNQISMDIRKQDPNDYINLPIHRRNYLF